MTKEEELHLLMDAVYYLRNIPELRAVKKGGEIKVYAGREMIWEFKSNDPADADILNIVKNHRTALDMKMKRQDEEYKPLDHELKRFREEENSTLDEEIRLMRKAVIYVQRMPYLDVISGYRKEGFNVRFGYQGTIYYSYSAKLYAHGTLFWAIKYHSEELDKMINKTKGAF